MAHSRVLMLCYYYPPLLTSGTTRSLAFTEHLPAYGWEPTVLTVANSRDPWASRASIPPAGVEIVRSFEANLNGFVDFLNGASSKLWSLFGAEWKTNYYRELFCIPDPQIAWFSTPTGVRIAKKVDCIYATCSPFSSALSAAWIKRISGKPMVLDFRDPWSLNPHLSHTGIHTAIAERMERFALATCDALILNTPGALALYKKKYPRWAEKFLAIPNGYDSLQLVDPPTEHRQGDSIVIKHVGNFYGARKPDTLLEALCALDDPRIEFVQVGSDFPSLANYRDRLNIRVTGMIAREEALAEMKEASILYLKQGFEDGVTNYIAVAAKTYEYLATGLPILADCPPGDNADIVSKHAAFSYVVTSNAVNDIKNALVDAIEMRGWEEPGLLDNFVESFDRRKLTQKLAATFSKVAAA